jgi:hypothetical protein
MQEITLFLQSDNLFSSSRQDYEYIQLICHQEILIWLRCWSTNLEVTDLKPMTRRKQQWYHSWKKDTNVNQQRLDTLILWYIFFTVTTVFGRQVKSHAIPSYYPYWTFKKPLQDLHLANLLSNYSSYTRNANIKCCSYFLLYTLFKQKTMWQLAPAKTSLPLDLEQRTDAFKISKKYIIVMSLCTCISILFYPSQTHRQQNEH